MATKIRIIKQKQNQALEALQERIEYLCVNQSFTPELVKPAINLAISLGCSLHQVQQVFDAVFDEIVQIEGLPC